MRRNLQRNIKIGDLNVNTITKISNYNNEKLEEAKHGGKIILPLSALRKIAVTDQVLKIFRLFNGKTQKTAYCGVLTFDGKEKEVSVPQWVLNQLQCSIGEKILVEYLRSQTENGVFAQFQPLSKNFSDITDAKAVLEHCLRAYAVISCDDIISIYYNNQTYELKVCETKPTKTIAIAECDLQVDFAPIENDTSLSEVMDLKSEELMQNNSNDESFTGSGMRIDGKTNESKVNESKSTKKRTKKRSKIGSPDYEYSVGTLTFKRIKQNIQQKTKEK